MNRQHKLYWSWQIDERDFIYPQANLIAGVDEVGRGPLVGAVVTAAVILDPNRPIVGLADSKTQREAPPVTV